MTQSQYLNQAKISGFKGHTVQISTRLNFLVIKATQAIKIDTQAISQPDLTPRF